MPSAHVEPIARRSTNRSPSASNRNALDNTDWISSSAEPTGKVRLDQSAGQAVVPLEFGPAIAALGRCILHTTRLLFEGRIRQPARHVGRAICFADGTRSRVYRETIIDRQRVEDPTVLIVGFRLRHVHRAWLHAVFRGESELNTILFAGFDGFVSKLWLRHDQHDLYRGVYQWDGKDSAVAYVRALWWALVIVSDRDSIHYSLLPGQLRDDVLADPDRIVLAADTHAWWRPVQDRAAGVGDLRLWPDPQAGDWN